MVDAVETLLQCGELFPVDVPLVDQRVARDVFTTTRLVPRDRASVTACSRAVSPSLVGT